MSPERFAQLFIEALKAQGETLPIHYDEREFALRIGENPEAAEKIAYLQNAHNECENASKDRHAEIINHFARLSRRAMPPSDYTIAKPRLGLSLSTTAYLDVLRCRKDLDGVSVERGSLLHRPLTDELVVLLVDDDGDSFYFLGEGYLEKWGVTMETAMWDATMNLAKKSLVIEQVGSILRSEMRDSYDAARMVLVELLRELPVKGNPVALAPDRDCLILTGSEDMDGLTQMAAMGHVRFEESTRLISGRPVVLEEGKWTLFNPPETVRQPFIQLAQVYDEVDYWQQSGLLRQVHKKRNDSVQIADVVRVPTGAWNQFATMTRWENGSPALLPRVDVVTFFDRVAATVGFADWNDVVRVVGNQMVRTADVPPRYRVANFPTPAELQAMGTEMVRAVDLKPTRPRLR